MATRYTVISDRRQKSLKALNKARRHHRNLKQARSDAIRDTLLVLQEELRARRKVETRQKQQARLRQSSGSFDLFQGLH
jgi:hypothetical protein